MAKNDSTSIAEVSAIEAWEAKQLEIERLTSIADTEAQAIEDRLHEGLSKEVSQARSIVATKIDDSLMKRLTSKETRLTRLTDGTLLEVSTAPMPESAEEKLKRGGGKYTPSAFRITVKTDRKQAKFSDRLERQDKGTETVFGTVISATALVNPDKRVSWMKKQGKTVTEVSTLRRFMSEDTEHFANLDAIVARSVVAHLNGIVNKSRIVKQLLTEFGDIVSK